MLSLFERTTSSLQESEKDEKSEKKFGKIKRDKCTGGEMRSTTDINPNFLYVYLIAIHFPSESWSYHTLPMNNNIITKSFAAAV